MTDFPSWQVRGWQECFSTAQGQLDLPKVPFFKASPKLSPTRAGPCLVPSHTSYANATYKDRHPKKENRFLIFPAKGSLAASGADKL